MSASVRQPCNGLKRYTKQMVFQLAASLMLTGPERHKRRRVRKIKRCKTDLKLETGWGCDESGEGAARENMYLFQIY